MSEKGRRFNWLEKIKNVKHIDKIIIAIFIVVVLLIYFSTFKTKSKTSSDKNSEKAFTVSVYVDDLENNLERTLNKIKGVSDASVMVTLDYKDAVIENDVIKTSSFPSIKGIVVVANGVQDTYVKLNVLKAIEAVVEINNGNIEILSTN